MNCDMKRSISLYSYQDEYYDGKLDLEGCLRETAKTGATGVELLAEQMIKKFPLPIETEEFREQWFGWLEKYIDFEKVIERNKYAISLIEKDNLYMAADAIEFTDKLKQKKKSFKECVAVSVMWMK